MQNTQQDICVQHFDAVVVGAGFAGVYAVYKFREMGLSVRALEAGASVGGTWYHNRYPGARCDIESLDYSFSFSNELQQEWKWSERYASQPEILAYIKHVVDRFDLAKDIKLDTYVVSAEFNEDTEHWIIKTETGETFSAKYVVMATGVLSVHQVPSMKGLETFKKKWFHTGDWPKQGVDVAGKRVGVIGTGSSATQLIPIVAEQAGHLYIFQRTPNYTMPAQNHLMKPEVEKEWKATYPERRKFARKSGFGHNQVSNHKSGKEVSNTERYAELEERWRLGGLYMMRAFKDILTDPEVNQEAAEFVRDKIRNIVKDPETAEALCPPEELYIGTKRLCSGTNYYETFNRENVSLVNVKKNAIDRITPNGLLLEDGTEYELDTIIFATGFDAMTGAMNRINPVGREGRRLREEWADGPRTYLGMTITGFPNMFVIAGPGSPSVFSNMVTSIEQHVEWVADCARHMEANGISTIEAKPEAQDAWTEHVTDAANKTLYAYAKDTWFYGANTPGKPVVFMPYVGGVGNYYQHILNVAQDDYKGYKLNPTKRPSSKVA